MYLGWTVIFDLASLYPDGSFIPCPSCQRMKLVVGTPTDVAINWIDCPECKSTITILVADDSTIEEERR